MCFAWSAQGSLSNVPKRVVFGVIAVRPDSERLGHDQETTLLGNDMITASNNPVLFSTQAET